MSTVNLIAAMGTPLDPDEHLHEAGVEAQLERLWAAGITGIFAGGTIGVMPLLTDEVYAALVKSVVRCARGKAELLVGAGDLSFARTRQRIAYINQFEVDGVVVIPPYFMQFGQKELIAYYRALADVSRAPLYLYDIPQRTHTHLEHETVLALTQHPNIAGIKCSGELERTLELIGVVGRRSLDLRIILARPDELEQLVADGIGDHLDGMYALAPTWAMQIVRHAGERSDCPSRAQADLTLLRNTMRKHGGMSAYTVLMNACGVPGCFAPLPFITLTDAQAEVLLNEPVVNRFLASERYGVREAFGDEAEADVPIPNA